MAADLLVVDRYAINAIWELALCSIYRKLMMTYNLADRIHDCYLLLDQNSGLDARDYSGLVPENCTLLGGSRYAFPLQLALRFTSDGHVAMFQPEHFTIRSRISKRLARCRSILLRCAKTWGAGIPIFSGRAMRIMLSRHRTQGIDTPEGWTSAEWMFRAMKSAKVNE